MTIPTTTLVSYDSAVPGHYYTCGCGSTLVFGFNKKMRGHHGVDVEFYDPWYTRHDVHELEQEAKMARML